MYACIRWFNLGAREIEHGDFHINLDRNGQLGQVRIMYVLCFVCLSVYTFVQSVGPK